MHAPALIQTLLMALIVGGCTAYAAWALLPNALRRVLAQQLLRLRWPAPLTRVLQTAAAARSGCACDGCDKGAPRVGGAAAGVQPIRIHRPTRLS